MPALPPYAELLGLRVEREAGGTIVLLPPHAGVVGRPGFLHGGAIAGLCEFAAFLAVGAAQDPAQAAPKPITVSIDYLRGGRVDPTWARAEIVRIGRRVAHVEVRAWQEDEARPIALARLNFKLDSTGAQ